MQRRIQLRILKTFAGTTLIDFLVQRFPYHNRCDWLARIAQARVHVSGHPADGGQQLGQGDLVEYLASDIAEPKVNEEIAVVFEDDDLLVVNKPANLPSHPGGRYFQHTLWALLKTRFGIEQPALINRLDRETSGLTVVAKTAAAMKDCRAQFSGRLVQKSYLALVEGAFPDRLEAKGWLEPDTTSPVKKKQRFVATTAIPETIRASQVAETIFKVREKAGKISMIEAIPLTGRLHQIRATLQSVGFPLVGDKLYGPDPAIFIRFCNDQLTADDCARLRLGRQALHAASLRLHHPRTHRRLELEAPLPTDMAMLLAEARPQKPVETEPIRSPPSTRPTAPG